MTRHLDDASLLEILYLNDLSDERAAHLERCTSCHDRFVTLRSEIDLDRSAHGGRIASKPEQFWQTQRDEIVARATSRSRGAFAFLRYRSAISIIIAVLLVSVGLVMMRAASQDVDPAGSSHLTDTGVRSEVLFEEEDLRTLDPWQSDELESLHQIVEWEEWIENDREKIATAREES